MYNKVAERRAWLLLGWVTLWIVNRRLNRVSI